MEFRVLGYVELVDDHGAVIPVSAMRRRLLAVLLVHAGEAVSVDRLVDLLWPDGAGAGAVGNLHAHVSRLRTTLRSARTGVLPELVTCPAGYLLRLDAGQLDAARFECLVQQARGGAGPQAVVDLLDKALGLWRGHAYGEFTDEHFAAPEKARLTELRLGSIEHRAEALLELGRHAELVAPLQRFTAEHPLRERSYGALMLALYRCGRLADALAVFRELRQRLVTELGLEPSATLQRLQADLLAQRPELDGQPEPVRPLPEPVTSFLGREREVVSITAALPDARLLTLIGVGGVGKTRLALAVAAAAARRYPDGAWLCELAPVSDPDAVAHAAATALDITHRAGMTVEDSVVAPLRSRRMLLVLDNCEHVVDAAARLAQRIAASCPGVTVLATSRQPLAVEGEHRWPVEPLPLPAAGGDPGPAVRLFHDRAAAVDPAFDPDADVGAVTEICCRLDGVPLAIELAAARIAALDVA
ncbi:MAG: AfsR/SARP family transcriptional regulator, partial [Pseudonocardiaceae bacterium]